MFRPRSQWSPLCSPDRILIVCIALISTTDFLSWSHVLLMSEHWERKLTQTAAKTFSTAIFCGNKKYCGKSPRNCQLGPDDLRASYWPQIRFLASHWPSHRNYPSFGNAWRVFLARCYITQSFRVMALEIHTSISFYSPQGRGHSRLTRHLNIETRDCESLKLSNSILFPIVNFWIP